MGLEEFLPHRRVALLWRYAPELDADGVHNLIHQRRTVPCEHGWAAPLKRGHHQVAVLGDDGRFHLLVNEIAACGGRPREHDPVDVVRHRQWCYWWSDGVRYRIQAPADARNADHEIVRGSTGERVAGWVVTLTDVVDAPELVPGRRRCSDDSARHSPWPGYHGHGNGLGRLRARLARAFGPMCSTCGEQWGTHVDHDHFTGRVRGLLCAGCNTRVDECPHVSGCPFGDYLNYPPAAHLHLRYPRSQQADRDPDGRIAQKIAALGFDPLYRGVKDEQRRAPHLPAPEHSGTAPTDWADISLF